MSPRRSPYQNESVLTERLFQRDEQAFRWLYTHYSVTLLMHILKLVHDREQANDLLQDVFVKIWQNVGNYDPGKGRLYTWMRNIAQHTAIDAIRASKTKSRPSAMQLIPIDDDALPIIDQHYWVQAANPDHIGLNCVIARLQPQHQQLIKLLYLNGYTQLEAANELDVPVGTIKTRLRAAIRVLKRLF